MSLVDMIPVGIELLRLSGREGVYTILSRVFKAQPISPAYRRRIRPLGASVGLSEVEVDEVISGSPNVTVLPSWLKWVLVAFIVVVLIGSAIAVTGSYVPWYRNPLYVPGTDYASIRPKDFL
jgi:hypothetical protein